MQKGLIGTGFGYTAPSPSLPGAWYRHSWGLDYSTKMPRVIETTHKFNDYYGVELDNEECKCFVLQNVLPMVKTVIEKIHRKAYGGKSQAGSRMTPGMGRTGG